MKRVLLTVLFGALFVQQLALCSAQEGEASESYEGDYSLEDEPESEIATPEPDEAFDHIAETLGVSKEAVRTRIAHLFPLLDRNKDRFVDETELNGWLASLDSQVADKRMEGELRGFDKDGSGGVTLTEFEDGYFGERQAVLEAQRDQPDKLNALRRRHKAADKDQSGDLNLHELTLLLNPERDPDLLAIEVQDFIENKDTNKDGKVSLEEFTEGMSEWSEEELGEVQSEFREADTNGDGALDTEEVSGLMKMHTRDFDTKREREQVVKISLDKIPDRRLDSTLFVDKAAIFLAYRLREYGDLLQHPERYNLAGYQAPDLPYAPNQAKEKSKDEL